jgi:hypothetical protein
MNRMEPEVVPWITFRIPGDWTDPKAFLDRLPPGVRLEADSLILPDGAKFEITPVPADREFPHVFESACRRSPTEEELAVVARYRVNIVLSGPGGSMDAARSMMQAGAAVVRAGGAGVFIDNSALAHGGEDWIDMADDGGPDALSFAFAAIIRGEETVYTMGMQVMGLPDLLLNASDVDEHGDMVVDIIRYASAGEKPIDVGHILADEHGPRFQVVARETDAFDPESSMHNPWGRLKIVSVSDIAQSN